MDILDMNDKYVDLLKERGVKPTSIRILILKEMFGFSRAFNLLDLEITLDTVDKSTISRTIHLFHNRLLIHSIDDGSGSIKYSVCRPDCSCEINDLHVHFYCKNCKNTFCLESISIPKVQLPEFFRLESVNFVLKGLCASCSKFAT